MNQLSPNPAIDFRQLERINIDVIETPKVLIIGQSNNVGITGLQDTEGLDLAAIKLKFGATQHITQGLKMIYNVWNKSNAKPSTLDAFVIADDVAWTAATATLTASAWTVNETLELVDSDINNVISVTLTSGMTATQVATAIVAAFNLNPDRTAEASNLAGVITLTQKNKGKQGNNGFVFVKNWKKLTGGTLAVTAGYTGGAGEASTTDITNIITAITNKRYNFIVYPYENNENLMVQIRSRVTELEDNFIKDGIVYTAITDTYSNVVSFLTTNQKAFRNPLVSFVDKKITNTNYSGGKFFITPLQKASLMASLHSLVITSGSGVSNYYIGQDFGFPALLGQKSEFNVYLSDVNDSGYDGFTGNERSVIQSLSGSLFAKQQNSVVTDTIYTMTTDVNYKFLTREMQSQFVKEFIVNYMWTTFGSYTIFNQADSESEILGTCGTIFDILAGNISYNGNDNKAYQIFLSDEVKKEAFLDICRRGLRLTRDANNDGILFIKFILDNVYVLRQIFISVAKV